MPASIPLSASNVQPLEVFLIAGTSFFVIASTDLSGRGNLRGLRSLFRSVSEESLTEIASLPAAPRNDTRGGIASSDFVSLAMTGGRVPRNDKRRVVKKNADPGHHQVYQWATDLAPVVLYSGVWWSITFCGITRSTVPEYSKFQQPYWSVKASS